MAGECSVRQPWRGIAVQSRGGNPRGAISPLPRSLMFPFMGALLLHACSFSPSSSLAKARGESHGTAFLSIASLRTCAPAHGVPHEMPVWGPWPGVRFRASPEQKGLGVLDCSPVPEHSSCDKPRKALHLRGGKGDDSEHEGGGEEEPDTLPGKRRRGTRGVISVSVSGDAAKRLKALKPKRVVEPSVETEDTDHGATEKAGGEDRASMKKKKKKRSEDAGEEKTPAKRLKASKPKRVLEASAEVEDAARVGGESVGGEERSSKKKKRSEGAGGEKTPEKKKKRKAVHAPSSSASSRESEEGAGEKSGVATPIPSSTLGGEALGAEDPAAGPPGETPGNAIGPPQTPQRKCIGLTSTLQTPTLTP